MTLDAHHDIHMPPCTAPPTVCAHDEDDHIVKDAADLEAADHVADRHVIGIDHAGRLGSRARLADHAQNDQSIHPAGLARTR